MLILAGVIDSEMLAFATVSSVGTSGSGCCRCEALTRFNEPALGGEQVTDSLDCSNIAVVKDVLSATGFN